MLCALWSNFAPEYIEKEVFKDWVKVTLHEVNGESKEERQCVSRRGVGGGDTVEKAYHCGRLGPPHRFTCCQHHDKTNSKKSSARVTETSPTATEVFLRIDLREREKHRFVVPLINVFIDLFSYVP